MLNNKWKNFKTYASTEITFWPIYVAKVIAYNFFEKYDDTLIFDTIMDGWGTQFYEFYK